MTRKADKTRKAGKTCMTRKTRKAGKAGKTRVTRKTFMLTIETTGTPIPPQGPWGATWLVVRAAGVLAAVAHIAVPYLLR